MARSVRLPTPYYDRDGITIYHGDCREIVPLLPKVDAIVTDPPYGLGAIMQGGEAHWPLWEGRSQAGLPWDSEAPTWVAGMVEQTRYAIVWGGNYFPLPPTRGWLVWDKIVREFSSGHCELAWTNLDQPVRAFNWSHGALASEGKVHPTQKPIALMRWCIEFLPADTDLILDPFMGSGTTLRAAADLGRRAIGIEINEDYCKIAVERLRQGVLL
jgi:site-specific DNA-methyltransferase (adenine-specific)